MVGRPAAAGRYRPGKPHCANWNCQILGGLMADQRLYCP